MRSHATDGVGGQCRNGWDGNKAWIKRRDFAGAKGAVIVPESTSERRHDPDRRTSLS